MARRVTLLLAGLTDLVAGRGVGGRGHGLFAAFPPTDDAEQHLVYDAESVQLVGTVNAAALQAALEQVADSRWRPLAVSQASSAPSDSLVPAAGPTAEGARAPLSIGIGDFRNTSIGQYFELAVAFPACEEEALVLPCGSFMDCQDKMPDCAHTYMLANYVNDPNAVRQIRMGGIHAQHASAFSFSARELEEGLGRVLDFSIRGPHGEEVLEASVQAAVALPGREAMAELAMSRRGFRLQPFVGPPNVLGPSQARHMCAFPDNLDVVPARISGPVRVGELFAALDFQIEGALHLRDLRVVRLPPWGFNRGQSSPSPLPQITDQKVSAAPVAAAKAKANAQAAGLSELFGLSPRFDDDEEAWEEGARAPWAGQQRKGFQADKGGAGGGAAEFPWDLHDAHAKAPAPRPGQSGRSSTQIGSQGGGLKEAPFPWDLHAASAVTTTLALAGTAAQRGRMGQSATPAARAAKAAEEARQQAASLLTKAGISNAPPLAAEEAWQQAASLLAGAGISTAPPLAASESAFPWHLHDG